MHETASQLCEIKSSSTSYNTSTFYILSQSIHLATYKQLDIKPITIYPLNPK